MEKKQYKLIQFLSKNRNVCFSVEQLSLFLDVSERSVNRYINEINTRDSKKTFEIVSVYGKGYKLQVNNEVYLQEYISRITEFTRMQKYILLSVLKDENVNIYMLEQKYYMSKASVLRDIDRLDALIFELYGVKLKFKLNKFSLIGSELMIRNLLYDILNSYEDLSKILPLYQISYYTNIFNSFQHLDNKFSETGNLSQKSKYIFISVLRIISGNYIENSEALNLISLKDESKYLNQVRELKSSIEKSIDIIIKDTELKYWLVILITDGANVNDFNIDSIKQINAYVRLVLNDLDSKFGFMLSEDVKLINNLIYHVITSMSGYILNSKISPLDNVKIQEIKASQRLAYFFSVEFCNFLNTKLGIVISSDEIDYITLHFATSLESSLKSEVLSLGLDIDESNGVREYVKVILNNSLEKGRIINAFDGNFKVDISGYDYILSDTFVDDEKFILFDYKNIDAKDLDFKLNIKKSRRVLMKYLNENFFMSDIVSEDRFEVIEVIGEKLKTLGLVTGKEVNNFIEREFKSSTVISENIAMPHAIIDGETFVYIGKLKNPIVWKNNMVSLVIVIGLKDGHKENKELVQSILYLCKYTAINVSLMYINSFEEMYDILMNSEIERDSYA